MKNSTHAFCAHSPLFPQPSKQKNKPKKTTINYILILLGVFILNQATAQISVSTSKTEPNCFGYTNGTAQATATGGTAPYTYTWNTGSRSQAISSLPAATYTVTATDSRGATATAIVLLSQPNQLVISNVRLNNICSGAGTETASILGGTAPYTYNWGGGFSTNPASLPPNDYILTITDSRGCTANSYFRVPALLSVNIRTVGLRCFGDCDASAEAITTGGAPPFSYLWNTGATTQTLAGVPAGTYSVTVFDATFCSATTTVTIINPSLIVINTQITNPNCGGGATNSATASASGGRAPYTYSWSNGQNTATATGLSLGSVRCKRMFPI
jgi:hypothetical protein